MWEVSTEYSLKTSFSSSLLVITEITVDVFVIPGKFQVQEESVMNLSFGRETRKNLTLLLEKDLSKYKPHYMTRFLFTLLCGIGLY